MENKGKKKIYWISFAIYIVAAVINIFFNSYIMGKDGDVFMGLFILIMGIFLYQELPKSLMLEKDCTFIYYLLCIQAIAFLIASCGEAWFGGLPDLISFILIAIVVIVMIIVSAKVCIWHFKSPMK